MSIESRNVPYIFDVHVLGGQVFNMVGEVNNGPSLKIVLEVEGIM